jgi:hypothetical protein
MPNAESDDLISPFTNRSRANPNRRQQDTFPRRESPRREQNPARDPRAPRNDGQQQQPPQSSVPFQINGLFAAVQQQLPVLLVSAQSSRQDREGSRTAPATPRQRGNPPLVTPGVSPDRSPTNQNTRQNRNSDVTVNDNNTNNSSNRTFATNNIIGQVLQRAAASRLQFLRDDLTNLTGAGFDRAYMQLQVALHVELVVAQASIQSMSTSQELRQLAAEGMQMDQEHLGEARSLLSGTQATNDTQETRDQRLRDPDSGTFVPNPAPNPADREPPFTSENRNSTSTQQRAPSRRSSRP